MNRSDIPTASQRAHQPKLYVGRIAAGAVLFVMGLILLPTVAMTAAGIALCMVGICLVGMAFVSRRYGAAHSPSHAAHKPH
ncbi:hypothetical protein [Roseimicrobium sp. ORNL1]|uniref:hypothetical protein n=1 Tax=Roseimicrobium sp. ORNL1 TaxID=2711231 RepID=UPI0013E1C9C7|nr:hypothetical protein [Roseimicrobium sp. ORNL1]QIF04674.1 hypothetical protein G5S37_25135 [Roseimicrobium sp. ORNL1]